jgi:cellulose biosynthesis protein BcsQ
VHEPHSGTLYTFYSYKGGTGRSMALANFGCWLRRQRGAAASRILLIDWDLEAPGLHRYFPAPGPGQEPRGGGLIDYFGAMRKRLDENASLYERTSVDPTATTMRSEFPLDDYVARNIMPGIDLMMAGTLDVSYASRVSAFDWIEFHRKYGEIFQQLRNMILADYAYCLIDSRTGFNDTSGICTMLMPEKLILMFTLNRQSVAGVLDLAARAVEYRRGVDDFRPLAIFPVPSRIENAEQELKQKWRRQYQQEFEATLKSIYQLDGCDLGAYFDDVAIPHVSFYSYGEELAIVREETSDAQSLSRAYDSCFTRLHRLEFAWDTSTSEQRESTPPEKGAQHLSDQQSPVDGSAADSDIYISYFHLDNLSLSGATRGWVDTFHQALDVRLRQRLGSDVRIWRDTKLTAADRFDESIIRQIRNSRVFIAIVSPGFVKSSWCQKELDEFIQQAVHHRGSPQERVIKIVKSPVPAAAQPEMLRAVRGYDFYESTDAGRIREFDLDLSGSTNDPRFWERIDDVAFDLARLLESPIESQSASSRPGVFVAVSASDVSTQRERVIRELRQRGYRVHPERELSLEVNELMSMVRDQLARCTLSVHLFGNSYGVVPEGAARSIVALQAELAADRALSDQSFSRVLWIRPDLDTNDNRQQSLLQELERQLRANDELLRGDLDALKWTILEKLARVKSAAPDPVQKPKKSLYLICDQQDTSTGLLTGRYLADQGLLVHSSLDESTMERHRRLLGECDATVVCWGKATDRWLHAQASEVVKARASRTRRERLFAATLLVDPPSPAKAAYDDLDMTFDGVGQELQAVLPVFVSRLREKIDAVDSRRT